MSTRDLLKYFLPSVFLTAIITAAGCHAPQAYPGPELPADQTATLRINPPQANIGFELTSVSGHPFTAEENASIRSGKNTLTLNVWPTSQTSMQMSDPAFATMYSMQDSDYSRSVTITFDAAAGATYGMNGNFNMGASPSDASYSAEVFNMKTMEVVGRSGSNDPDQQADQTIQGIEENQSNDWTVKEGAGS